MINRENQRTPRNTTKGDFLARLHIPVLTLHVKQATRFWSEQQLLILDLMAPKHRTDICSVVIEKPLTQEFSLLHVVLVAKHALTSPKLVRNVATINWKDFRKAAKTVCWAQRVCIHRYFSNLINGSNVHIILPRNKPRSTEGCKVGGSSP